MKITTEKQPTFTPFKLVIEVESQEEAMVLTAFCAVANTPAAAYALDWTDRERIQSLARLIDRAISQREV